MKKLLIICLVLCPITTYAMTPEAALVSVIHICKNKELYNKEKKNNSKEDMKEIDCFCKAFKDFSESEILEKMTLAWDYGIPQYDMALKIAEAIQCSETK